MRPSETSAAAPSTIAGLECPVCHQRGFQNLRAYTAHTAIFRNRSVVSCLKCHLAYLYPMPSTEALRAYYENGTYLGPVADKTPFASPTRHHQARAQIDYLQTRLKFSGGFDLLNVGAGYGVLEQYARKQWGEKARLFAIETDAKAREALDSAGVKTGVDLDAFKGKVFDAVVLSHGLEYVNEPIAYLSKMLPSLKPQGVAFIEVPNEEFKFADELEPQVVFYNPSTLRGVLEAAGYEIVDLTTCGLPRSTQREMNERLARRSQFLERLPFTPFFKKIQAAGWAPWKGSDPKDPLSATDVSQSNVYGDDRIWIRCLAKGKSRGK